MSGVSQTRDLGVQKLYNLGLSFVGAAFLYADLRIPDAMAPELYGEFAYEIDASIWAISFMVVALMNVAGLVINGAWFWSPMLRIFGCAGHIALFSTIAISALSAPFGLVLTVFSACLFLPMSFRFLVQATVDMVRRFQRGRY